MNELSRVSALLLAAGRSRRMGAFKPLLPFGHNGTVAETCIANLRAAGIEEIVVVIGHRAEEMKQRLANLSVRFAVNREAESEMNISIKRGVEMLAEDSTDVLIHLVDLPGVAGETIKEIATAPPVIKDEPRLIVPENDGRGGHPVLIDCAYRTELLSLDPARGLRSLFDEQHHLVRRLSVGSPYILRDIDTPEDYRNLHNEVFGFAPRLIE
ncbi:MAG: nucleotidyltransferase family protein [Pyrinomonadaceae bacterium]|nr:nucleotidyltransferase family protein [Pyrinomonadaceae bacterium]